MIFAATSEISYISVLFLLQAFCRIATLVHKFATISPIGVFGEIGFLLQSHFFFSPARSPTKFSDEVVFFYNSITFCYHISGEVSGKVSDETSDEPVYFFYFCGANRFLLHISKSGTAIWKHLQYFR
jgi:hypothetical protein